MGFKQDKYRCCGRFELKPHRIVAFLTGVQVIRAIWEIWGCVDNEWPPLIDTWVTPTVYASCLLSICMMIVSVCATVSAYKGHIRVLNINWWIYYGLIVLGFINSCANLSIMCIGKDRYVAGCFQQQQQQEEIEEQKIQSEAVATSTNVDSATISGCVRMWEESVVWAAVGSLATLLLNVVFAFMLYRVKSQQRLFSTASIHPQQPSQRSVLSPYNHPLSLQRQQPKHSTDEDGFQVIELK
ncbi:hypothetical protein BDC45DRAFT_558519 [Circinella umbellata]|nr:hypothetical protein BDC45DRAFT_558519 [Circinella umbellata]